MIETRLSQLWAFARGDTAGPAFEKWFLAQTGLEDTLGEGLHWRLASASYSDRDEVWNLRKGVAAALEPFKHCECASIRDISAIPMGGDFYFERVFQTLDRVVEYGSGKWWLYISKCTACGTVWLVAQDDRIYDDFFLRRISDEDLAAAQSGMWLDQFQTYEDVLTVGCKFSSPPRFLDAMAASLVWTVEDLLNERPPISAEEIGNLLGLSEAHAATLIDKVQRDGARARLWRG
jgi:hypothetical protein